MDNISFGFIDDGFDNGQTIIDNIFINHFMPKAYSPLYSTLFIDGLMRCFGEKESHFYSVEKIAEKFDISSRSVQEIYQYWEQIKIHHPNHKFADSDGYIQILKRVPRFLRYSPSEIKSVSRSIAFLKGKQVNNTITWDEIKTLNNIRHQLDLMLTDFKMEKDTEYKYQTSNAILFLRNLKGLDDGILKELFNKQSEVNSFWADRKKDKRKGIKTLNNIPEENNIDTLEDNISDNRDVQLNAQINTNSINKNKYIIKTNEILSICTHPFLFLGMQF